MQCTKKKNSEMLGSERKGRNCIRKGLMVEGRGLWKTSHLGRKKVHVMTHLLISKHIGRPDKVQQKKNKVIQLGSWIKNRTEPQENGVHGVAGL